MTTTQEPNAYLRTKVLTASPEELRLMLLDGAIKFLNQGIEALQKKDYEGWFNGMTRCRNIVLELLNSISANIDPDLHRNVTSLYTFLYTSLVEANLERDIAKGKKVLELLEYERETWLLAMKKLSDERAAAIKPDEDSVRAVARETSEASKVTSVPAYRPLSVQG